MLVEFFGILKVASEASDVQTLIRPFCAISPPTASFSTISFSFCFPYRRRSISVSNCYLLPIHEELYVFPSFQYTESRVFRSKIVDRPATYLFPIGLSLFILKKKVTSTHPRQSSMIMLLSSRKTGDRDTIIYRSIGRGSIFRPGWNVSFSDQPIPSSSHHFLYCVACSRTANLTRSISTSHL